MNALNTYGDIYIKTRKILRDQKIEQSDLEARLICSAACEKSVMAFLRDSRMYVTDETYLDTVKAMLRRRLRGEPVAYITGSWEFYGLPMKVTRDVLIPRVDTEVLAERAIAFCRLQPEKTVRVLDLCSGTGCVGIAIAVHAPNASVLLGDVSPKALAVGRSNVLHNNVTQTVRSMQIDALAGVDSHIGKFDLITANPPYIPSRDIETLDRGVRDYEPHLALDGGGDGLDFYRAITANFREVLNPGGGLFYEVGIHQASPVAAIMRQYGFEKIGFAQDTLGIDRVVYGRLQ